MVGFRWSMVISRSEVQDSWSAHGSISLCTDRSSIRSKLLGFSINNVVSSFGCLLLSVMGDAGTAGDSSSFIKVFDVYCLRIGVVMIVSWSRFRLRKLFYGFCCLCVGDFSYWKIVIGFYSDNLAPYAFKFVYV